MSIENNSEFLIYQTDDGQTKIDVRMENETVWLSQMQMTELFQTTKQNISLHINNVFKEGELDSNSTVKKYLIVQNEGNRRVSREIDHYNLDEFMNISEREILTHAGKVSHEIAMLKANEEFERFTERTKNELSSVERHFIESLDSTMKQLKESNRKR